MFAPDVATVCKSLLQGLQIALLPRVPKGPKGNYLHLCAPLSHSGCDKTTRFVISLRHRL